MLELVMENLIGFLKLIILLIFKPYLINIRFYSNVLHLKLEKKFIKNALKKLFLKGKKN